MSGGEPLFTAILGIYLEWDFVSGRYCCFVDDCQHTLSPIAKSSSILMQRRWQRSAKRLISAS